jgi:uncharacterized protein (TIGR00369 family)
VTREKIEGRIASFHEIAPGAICDMFPFEVLSVKDDAVVLQCATEHWMRNTFGALHGGMASTILDQAMSLAAFCVKTGEGPTPCIEMQVSFHRPVQPGETVQIRVNVLSATKSLIRLSSQLHQYDKLCVSATGTYFQKHT